MKSTKLVALTMALSLFACRSGGKDDDDDGGDDAADDGADGGSADDTAIQDIQSDDMPVGTPVTVRGAVVVAVDAYGGRSGGVYVMEPEGGPYSGVFVFVSGSAAADLAPGDLVDVVGGEKDEFALDSDETGRTLTEISPPEGGSVEVTKVGDGEVPEPETLQPWELAADDFAESEPWEGVLVRFEAVRVNREPRNATKSDETLLEMFVTGPYIVQSALTAFDGIESGTCYSSIVGIGDYFFDYKLLPRSADDLVVGEDTDCLAPESTDELCDDDVDNDYNGFADCEDFSCADAAVACPVTEATVEAIQSGAIPADSTVSLVDVTVTGINRNRQWFWVQDGETAAENNGVFVFQFEKLPPDVVVGSTISLNGTVTEHPCSNDACADAPLTEITEAVIDLETVAEGPAPSAVIVDLATLASAEDGEVYEGVLVTLENVTVTQENDAMFGYFFASQGTTEIQVDDDIFLHEAQANDCIASLTGVVHRNNFEGVINILPRSASDVVPGTACK